MQPVYSNPDLAARLEVVGLASNELTEADAFAKAWKIPKAYGSLDELLADPDVDAVYNVLPAPLRCQWTVRALMAGKHVLSETPLCSNAREALMIQRAAEDSGKVMLEGSHPTCHPVTKRVREMLQSGAVGRIERIDLVLPVGHSLQGKVVCRKTGALMGIGCHAVAIVRALAHGEPRVASAEAVMAEDNPGVDIEMSCDLDLEGGAKAHFACSVRPDSHSAPSTFTVCGSNGIIRVKEWFTGAGRGANEINLEQFIAEGHRTVEPVDNPFPKTRDTFYFQLMSFVEEVLSQTETEATGMPWNYISTMNSPADAVRNMALIDAIYRAAGIGPRQTDFPPPTPYDHIGRSKL